jgi:hypothetical protein
VLSASGEITGEVAERLQRTARLLHVEMAAVSDPAVTTTGMAIAS